jgi:type VI secretion system protein ImpM
MSPTELSLSICYFGKLPSQGDFLKGGENLALLSILDQWATAGLGALARQVAWKTLYDNALPVNFAFMSSRNPTVIGGRMLPSQDSSSRRYPFMAAVTFEVDQPLEFIAQSPQSLSRLWSRLGRELAGVQAIPDAGPTLTGLASDPITLTTNLNVLQTNFADYLESQTIGSLQAMLNVCGHHVNVGRVLIGLGMLMKPVRASVASKMGKGLRLPLPADAMYKPLVAAFWLNLIAGFLDRSNFDLIVLERMEPHPFLILSFKGIAERATGGVFDPRVEDEDTVLLDDPDWVEDQLRCHYPLKKMFSYVNQRGLSLKTARLVFIETFLGA